MYTSLKYHNMLKQVFHFIYTIIHAASLHQCLLTYTPGGAECTRLAASTNLPISHPKHSHHLEKICFNLTSLLDRRKCFLIVWKSTTAMRFSKLTRRQISSMMLQIGLVSGETTILSDVTSVVIGGKKL